MTLYNRSLILTLLAGTAFAQIQATHAQESAPDTEALLQRLEQLEQRVQSLETENKDLKEQAEFTTERLENTENLAGKSVQFNLGPVFSDPLGNFTFKTRGVLEVENSVYTERAGGYDYNNGFGLRRARFGFEGTFYRDFGYRLETEFSGNQVNLYDAYITYTGVKPFTFTVGQHKAFFSLDQMTSLSALVFQERAMFTNAFGGGAAGRRIGLSASYARGEWTAAVGFFGENEGIARSNASPDEGYGVHSRVTWEPINDVGRLVHLGASGFWRTNQRVGDSPRSFRISDRPGSRVDGGNIIDSGTVTGVEDVYYWGAEAAGIYGPLLIQGEYGKQYLNRTAVLPSIDYSGYYIFGAWTITGESPSYRNGVLDRIRPTRNFDIRDGGWGALQLGLRYDRLDAGEAPGARAGNKAETFDTALNWWLNPNMRIVFNWVRFNGNNTPLDPVGTKTAGDSYTTRFHLDW